MQELCSQWPIVSLGKRNILVVYYVVMPLFDGRRRRCIDLPRDLDSLACLRKKKEMCGAGVMRKEILRRRRTDMFKKYMSRHDAILSRRTNLGKWQ